MLAWAADGDVPEATVIVGIQEREREKNNPHTGRNHTAQRALCFLRHPSRREKKSQWSVVLLALQKKEKLGTLPPPAVRYIAKLLQKQAFINARIELRGVQWVSPPPTQQGELSCVCRAQTKGWLLRETRWAIANPPMRNVSWRSKMDECQTASLMNKDFRCGPPSMAKWWSRGGATASRKERTDCSRLQWTSLPRTTVVRYTQVRCCSLPMASLRCRFELLFRRP